MIGLDQLEAAWEAFEALGVPAWEIDLEGTVLRTNAHAVKPSDVVLEGSTLIDLIDPADHAAINEGFAALAEGREDSVSIPCSLTPELGRLHVVAHGTCVVDAERRRVSVLTTSSDVTVLQQGARRWSRLIDHVGDVITVLAPDGIILYQNDTSEGLFGVPPTPGSSYLERVHPDDRTRVIAAFSKIWLNPGDEIWFESRYSHPDGRDLTLESHAVNRMDEDDVQGVIVVTRDVTDRHRAEVELRRAALHDSNTGLPNWRWLSDELVSRVAAASNGTRPSLIAVSIDSLVPLIASLGQDLTDWVIRTAAARIQQAIPEPDILAHLGRELFVVVCDVEDMTAAVELGQRLLAVFDTPVEVEGRTVQVRASIGVAWATDHEDPEVLLRRAEAAVAEAREGGGDRVVAAAADAHHAAARRLDLDVALRAAVANGQLTVHMQPQVNLRRGVISGFEALARWTHPVLGSISPAEFVPIAERSDLIQKLGEHVLERACEHHAQVLVPAVPGSILAVNVSGRQLDAPDFALKVHGALARAGLSPAQLCLEVTESLLLSDVNQASATLAGLRQDGVKIAVDDFGTGHSSLAQLKRFAMDYVKIDKSFVAGLDSNPYDTELIRVIVSMSRSMGVGVVAEGVEQLSQVQALADLGCLTSQGYHWGRPVPVDEVPAAVADIESRISEVSIVG